MVLFVGRLISDKGIDTLESAFSLLRDTESVHLVIAGDGPMMQSLRNTLGDNARVHLLGAIPSDNVRGLLHAADVFVHPSRYPEGLPTAILEAAAAGKPIIATAMGGSGEVVIPERTGLIVPPANPEALADAIRRLVNDRELRLRFGRAAAELCSHTFDWERIADVAELELSSLVC
jgi:rhamnosyl/mannosyltransferase